MRENFMLLSATDLLVRSCGHVEPQPENAFILLSSFSGFHVYEKSVMHGTTNNVIISLRAGSLVWVGDKEPRTGEPDEKNDARPILLASSFAHDTLPTSEPARRLCLHHMSKGAFVWDKSGIRIIGIMRVSVCLGAILIPEYLDFHSGYSAPRSRIAGIYSGYILIPEYPKRTRPYLQLINLPLPCTVFSQAFAVSLISVMTPKY